MDIFSGVLISEVVSTFVFVAIGLICMGGSWLIIEYLTPFSLKKEIQQEQNLAIAVLMGSIFISLSILIAGVITS